MARPQLENGFARIANELIGQLCSRDFSKREYAVLWAVIRYTYGYSRKTCPYSARLLAEATGIHPNHIRTTVAVLVTSGVLVSAGGDVGIQKDYEAWDVPKKQPKQLLGATKTVAISAKTKATKTVARSNQNSCSKATKTVAQAHSSVATDADPQTPKDKKENLKTCNAVLATPLSDDENEQAWLVSIFGVTTQETLGEKAATGFATYLSYLKPLRDRARAHLAATTDAIEYPFRFVLALLKDPTKIRQVATNVVPISSATRTPRERMLVHYGRGKEHLDPKGIVSWWVEKFNHEYKLGLVEEDWLTCLEAEGYGETIEGLDTHVRALRAQVEDGQHG